jgi:ligand-binding SRPBCC domain-containing protein
MGRLEYSVEIEAPVEKVFAFHVDPRNAMKLLPEDANGTVEITSEGSIGLGTSWHISAVIGGRKLELDEELVEFEENRRFTHRQTKGDMKRSEGTLSFQATNKGTKITETFDYELPYSVLGKILDRLKAGKDLERFTKERYEKSKEILEKG